MVTSPDFTNATNPLNRAITYDADNMPTRIVHANGATVDFVYDGVGKRTKKLVVSGKTVLYLGDHFEVENAVNIKYIFGGNLRLAQIKGSLTSYFHKDHLGSTAAVTDETGQKKESTTYEPFGSTRTQEGTAVSAYKFTDQEADVETNLYNYDARLYDPVLGMFVTPDSIIPRPYDPQSLNRFSYCRNNPLIYVDPSGHYDVDGATTKEAESQHAKDLKEKAEKNKREAAEANKIREMENDYDSGRPKRSSISIVGHLAAKAFGRLTKPNSYHLAISINPKAPNICPRKTSSITLGGQLSGNIFGGKLVSAPNYPGDDPKKATYTQEVQVPSDQTECEYIENLITAADTYQNNLDYTTPNISGMPFVNDGQMPPGTYNSNSYVSGVISKAGGIPPTINTEGRFQVPGYQNPIPIP